MGRNVGVKGGAMAGAKRSKGDRAAKTGARRTAIKDLKVTGNHSKKISGGASGGTSSAKGGGVPDGDVRAIGGMLSLGGKQST
jgi:hypothetical protein